MLAFIIEIVPDLLEGILVFLYFTLFIGQKNYILNNKLKSFLFIILYTVFCYWTTTFTPTGLHSILNLIFATVLISFITGFNVFISAVCIAIIYIIFFFAEFIPAIPLMLIFKIDVSGFYTPNIFILLLSICTLLKAALYFFLLHTKRLPFKKYINVKRNSPLSFISFQVFAFFIILYSAILSTSKHSHVFLYQALIITIGLLFIIISFLDYLGREKSLREQHKLESQQKDVKNLEEFVSTLRKEKHDYANHLNTINALCKLNNLEALERIDTYLSKLTAQVQSSYHSFSTGNDYINALLAVKNNIAKEKNIHLRVDCNAPISELNIPDSDLISILENIIDNAFEALASSRENTSKSVSIYTYIEQGKYILCITNNGPQISEKDIVKLFEKGFSTKKDKQDHGFGLYITNQLVNKNNGTINVSSSPDETSFQITFNL